MSGYWVIHVGCDKARAAKGLRPFEGWHAAGRPEDDKAHEVLAQDPPQPTQETPDEHR